MTPERFQQIDRLVCLALERVPSERGAFINEVCRGDDDLREEVESLLEAHEKAGDFLIEPPSDAAAEVVAEHWGETIPAAQPATRLEDGAALGRYVVQHELGGGGMGTVYAAFDPELNRKVALKLVRPEAGKLDANEARRRLLREAQAMAQLSHPNVIAVYDVGTFADQVFIAMEYAEGSTLTKWLAEHQRPWSEIVNMFVQAGRGLAAAHAAGILHRDFKPDNVLAGKDGRPRVVDFGLARALSGEPEKRAPDDERAIADANNTSNLAQLGVALTEPGRLMGTPAYMAPEQLMGQGADHRTDQYSFCVALYQGLYGELPFKGRSIEALVREMSQGKAPAAASSQVPSRLRRAVLRGLRPEPADRYPSMDALLDELVLRAMTTRRRVLSVAILAMVAAIATLGGIVWKKRNAAQPSVQSIAILPLKNLGDASDEATVDGLTNGITTTVAQLTNATVISQNSVVRYKTSPKSLQEIGRELNVDAIVSASAKHSGSRIQVSTQLIHVATGRQLWTKSFENDSAQLPMLQADIAAGLLAEVESRRITPEQEARLEKLRSVKPEVYQACLKGWLLAKRGDPKMIQKSIDYFQEAIRQDPTYAPAYVGLADGYTNLGHTPNLVVPYREASRLATEALMKALSLDPKLGEAHAELAYVKIQLDFDWRAAEEEAKRAIELSPNDAMAHARYSMILMYAHRLEESLVEARLAERLDPLNRLAQQHIAWWFLQTKQYDRAIEEFRKGIELEPNAPFLHQLLSVTYHDAGQYEEALVEAQKVYELSGNQSAPRAGIAHMLVHLGKTDEAEKIVEEIKNGADGLSASGVIAKTYAALKRKEETLKWLEYSYESRSLGLLLMNRDEEFAFLRSDPRFQDLVKRVGWPQ